MPTGASHLEERHMRNGSRNPGKRSSTLRLSIVATLALVVCAILVPAYAVTAIESVASSASPSPDATPLAAPTVCQRDRLSMPQRRAIARPWIDALWAFYSDGDDAVLTTLATAHGMERLRAIDWRAQAVERNLVRFREVPQVLDLDDWQEWCADGNQLVGLDLAPIIQIAPGARTFDASRDAPTEAVQGAQVRSIALSFVRDPGSERWLLDDVRPSEFRPTYVKPRAARPCPGLRDPSAAADPFLMEPWCSADGDGRRIPTQGSHGLELAVSRPDCLAGAHEIAIGLPPGTPLNSDVGNVRFYLRDPGGKARRALGRPFGPPGFRRDFRPPSDAISSGITNGYATIWTSEKLGDEWLLVQVGNRFERWPRSIGGCGPA